MNSSSAQLMKWPDELLLIILTTLDNIEVLFSLMGLDTRLDQSIRDPCFTAQIDLIQLDDDERCGQVNTYIDRFCLDILPEIHHHIKCLKVQSTAMERLLLAADYSHLSQLDIFIPHAEPIRHLNGKETHSHFHLLEVICAWAHVRSCWVLSKDSLSRLAIHARSSSKEDTSSSPPLIVMLKIVERKIELQLRSQHQTETDVELESLFEVSVEKMLVLRLNTRVDDHCDHNEMVHHTTFSEEWTAVLFRFRSIISRPAIERSNLDRISGWQTKRILSIFNGDASKSVQSHFEDIHSYSTLAVLPRCPLQRLIGVFCWSTSHVLFDASGITHPSKFLCRLSVSSRWSIQSTSHPRR